MRACFASTRVASAADEVFQSQERVLTPGLPDLFEAFVVIGSTTHPVKILRNKRVIGIWQREPIHWFLAIVARICSYRQTNLGRVVSLLVHVLDVSNNNIGTRHQGWLCWTDCVLHRR